MDRENILVAIMLMVSAFFIYYLWESIKTERELQKKIKDTDFKNIGTVLSTQN